MDYMTAGVPPSIWGDQGVVVKTATKSNPNILDTEFVKNDKNALKGTYLLSKAGDIQKVKETANLIATILYDGELPDVDAYGELTKSIMAPHMNTGNPCEAAQQLHDLNAVYLLTVESFGRNDELIENTKQVTMIASKHPAKARVYGLTYQEHYGAVDAVALSEVEDAASINNILKTAGISKGNDGLYRINQ